MELCIRTVRQRLVRDAFLFEEPSAYVAGVDQALAEVARVLAGRGTGDGAGSGADLPRSPEPALRAPG